MVFNADLRISDLDNVLMSVRTVLAPNERAFHHVVGTYRITALVGPGVWHP